VTTEQLIVVNGVLASPFAVNHLAANYFYDIYRAIYRRAPALMKSRAVRGAFDVLLSVLSAVFEMLLS
jgi:hypothetical protein